MRIISYSEARTGLKSVLDGIDKLELLLGHLSGYGSRRIDDVHRLVYALVDVELTVIACRGHYQ